MFSVIPKLWSTIYNGLRNGGELLNGQKVRDSTRRVQMEFRGSGVVSPSELIARVSSEVVIRAREGVVMVL